MREISQRLAVAVAADGKPASGWRLAEVQEMYSEAYTEFLDSDLGKKLVARGGPGIIDRIIDITAERFETTSPTLTPFYETIEQIGQDLLVTLPEPQTPKATPKPKPTPVLSPDAKEKAEAAAEEKRQFDAKVRSFSHLVNEATLNFGVGSLKPKAGFVTVKLLNGRQYEYPHQEFEDLYQAAQAASLIR